jgi:hypothetical protein
MANKGQQETERPQGLLSGRCSASVMRTGSEKNAGLSV